MKKILVCFAFGVLLTGSVAAQEKEKEKAVRFGVKAGVNIANVRWKVYGVGGHERPMLTLNAGAYLTTPLNAHFKLQPEIAWATMGTLFTQYKITLGYINLPVLLKFNPRKSDFNIYLGPQAGFLLSAKEEQNIGGNTSDIKDEIKKMNFSAVFGIDVDISRVNLAARYDLGLTNISSTPQNINMKTRAFVITVGYRIL